MNNTIIDRFFEVPDRLYRQAPEGVIVVCLSDDYEDIGIHWGDYVYVDVKAKKAKGRAMVIEEEGCFKFASRAMRGQKVVGTIVGVVPIEEGKYGVLEAEFIA